MLVYDKSKIKAFFIDYFINVFAQNVLHGAQRGLNIC